jgi:MFS transporter, ACS family, hexuronate transporter
MLSHREVWAVVGAKFLSDGAWYFYMFWLPKFFGRVSNRHQRGGQHRLDSLRGLGRRLPGRRRIFELAAGARRSVNAVAQTRARRERGADAVGDAGAAIAFGRLGDFYFQPRVFRPAIVVHARHDSADRHDFPRAVGTLAGLVGFGGAMGGVLLGQIVGYCAITVTATRPRSSFPARCTSPRSF